MISKKKTDLKAQKKFQGKIKRKLIFIISFIALIILGGNATVLYFQSLQKTDGAIIDASGRNRMLSQRIGFFAEQVLNGDNDAKKILSEIVNLHEISFYALKNGGIAPGIADDRVLPATLSSIMPKVLYAEDLWVKYKEKAEIVINEPTFIAGKINSEVASAMFFIEQNGPEMLRRNNEMVKAYVIMNDSKQIQLNNILYTAVIINLLFLFWLTYIVRNFTKSLYSITGVAEDLMAGNLLSRSKIKTKDELQILSMTLNKVADEILRSQSVLEGQVHNRTEELNKSRENLEKQRQAILNILEDIEEEKDNVSKEKDKITAILQSIGDGVFVIDANHKIFMFNGAASAISGFGASTVIGLSCDRYLDFVYEKEGNKANQFIHDAMSTGEVKELPMHCAIVNKKGKNVSVSATAAPLKDQEGSVIGAVIVFKDVSKEAAIDRTKTEFVSLASHQLRTPLSTVNWYAEMLLNGDAGYLQPEQANYVEEIYRGNQRMVDLVNALLNVSRLELGTFAVEPKKIDMIAEAESVLGELEPQIGEKKLKIKTEFGKISEIMADPNLFRIILHNLLSNAVKYTPEKGEVKLSISFDNGNINLEVSDSGFGIPKEQQDKIFTKLFRADNVKEKDTTGTGLGLYIVKSIVDHSGGKIRFESQENKGTTFFITLPRTGMVKKEGSRKLDA